MHKHRQRTDPVLLQPANFLLGVGKSAVIVLLVFCPPIISAQLKSPNPANIIRLCQSEIEVTHATSW